MKNMPPPRSLAIIGDLIKYFAMLFVPFFIFGLVIGFIHNSILMHGFINPFSYSIGLSLIVVVIKHDINDILVLIGIAKENQIDLNARHAKTIQEIGLLMGESKYKDALTKVNKLLHEEPCFVNGLSLKGQILLEGFEKYAQAREYLEKVLELTNQEEEQYKLADSLIVTCYNREEE